MSEVERDANRLAVACVAPPLPDEVVADFSAAFDVTFVPPAQLGRVIAQGEVDALVISIDVRLGAAEIAAMPPRIRAIGTYSVGLDHIDLAAAQAHGLAVFNTPDVLADSVADAALFLLLAAARRGTESLALIRSRAWPGWTPRQLNGVELNGKVLGVYGMGAIGQRVARRARAFGMDIAYSNRTRLPRAVEVELGGAVYVPDALEMLGQIDALMLAAPSTPQTRGFLDAAALARARAGLLVVNVARGDLVVDAALIDGLRSGVVLGAGLDVFNGEPNLDPRYFDLPNVFMTPHIGSSTVEARRRMAAALVDGLRDWRRGVRPPNQIG